MPAVTGSGLRELYRDYLACLNAQDWPRLGQFVHEAVVHNGRQLGLSGYRDMLERDFIQIPDLRFEARMLVSEPPYLAVRLHFDCSPTESFLGLAVNGRRVKFAEHVTYDFRGGKIVQVWSIIDKAAIEAQL